MSRTTRVAAAAILATAGLAAAEDVDIQFERITDNSDTDVASQFNVNVATVDGDPGVIAFSFTNSADIASSISEIYFDDGDPGDHFTGGMIVQQIGADFEFGSANPSDLPGGQAVDPAFDVTPGLLAGAQGPPTNGIDDAGDLLVMHLTLADDADFDSVIDAIRSGDLRIGLHVRAIEGVDSDSFINRPVAIPLPTGAALAAATLGLAAVRRRR